VLAVPGAYVVKLTANGKTFSQPLTLKMDPRATITPLGLSRQFALATKLADMMNGSFGAISRLRTSNASPNPTSSPSASPDPRPQSPAPTRIW